MPFKIVHLLKRKTKATPLNADSLVSRSQDNRSETPVTAAVIQSLQGATIGNVNGSLFSNNHITTVNHNHYPHKIDDKDNENYHILEAADLILESQIMSHEIFHDLQPDGTLQQTGRIRDYTGRVVNQPTAGFLIRQYEEMAIPDLERDLEVLSKIRHPNILQLYGVCHTKWFRALVFHDMTAKGPMNISEYHSSLSGPAFISYIMKIIDQYTTVWHLLDSHGVASSRWFAGHTANNSGGIIVDSFWSSELVPVVHKAPCALDYWFPSKYSTADYSGLSHLHRALQTHSFDKSDLHYYYDVLASVCRMPGEAYHAFDYRSVHHRYSVLLRADLDSPKFTDFLTLKPQLPGFGELLPDMSIRFTVPTVKLGTMEWFPFPQTWRLVIKNGNPRWDNMNKPCIISVSAKSTTSSKP
ncbi:hypothetical protein C8J56DRAFT_956750 [Mycena floridula]|nr:hypothetical protein C8J56DRAFT_956750 [Mycena floridula]